MAEVSLLLWDIGGVLLSNAWDHEARRAAAEQFRLDPTELEARHERVDAEFETGRMDLGHYLAATVFYEPRPFTPEQFTEFIRSRSTPFPSALSVARSLRTDGRYVMAALNNESAELHQYRVDTFGLRDLFHIFLCSSTTGRLKPDPAAFRYALELTERTPGESLLLDDRLENVEAARSLGLQTVWVRDPERIRDDLRLAGVATN
jgi:putative hydrolase of the HAD superfamily